MRMLVAAGTLPLRATVPIGQGRPGGPHRFRYLYVANLTGGITTVSVARHGFPTYDVGADSVLDLGCAAQFRTGPLNITGGPGDCEVWVSTSLDEAYKLGRI